MANYKYYKRYCSDINNVENFEKASADNFKGWHCHHRLETHNSDGERRPIDIPADELKSLDMYYNRPASELIFLTRSEHMTLHRKGKHYSEETRNKISEAIKGNKHFLGKKHSEEAKMKIGAAKKEMHWFNNGEKCVRAKECPGGFTPGRLLI